MRTKQKTLLFLTGIQFGRKGRRDMLRSQRGHHEVVCAETIQRIARTQAEPTPTLRDYLNNQKP